MHFKSALIVCVVYFLTSARSGGLNSDQLKELDKLFAIQKEVTGGISEKEIAQIVEKTSGMEWKNLGIMFKYNSNKRDFTNFQDLLEKLADIDKTSDTTEVETLKSFEVNFLLDKFMELYEFNKQPGYLTVQQLLKVFDYWRKQNNFLKELFKELEYKKGVGCEINAVEFLLIWLEIKTEVCANNDCLVSFGEVADGEDDLNSTSTSMEKSEEAEYLFNKSYDEGYLNSGVQTMNFSDFMEKVFEHFENRCMT
ncbi:uncharacterized protein LOC126834474 [Adelges cooleyi]|uniref:uncharacterized protein LOC126834474 n=1 Tax=Adelges cooleyi TaxID=133065 RepID=UPI00217FDFE4|nr:uncharacterized protein LOC126834474 [Adelges cooleyi]